MNADDLLSFKEYSPVHESHTHGGSAEINVNSPSRQRSPYDNATTMANDPLQDLINSMSASVNVLHNEDRQRQSTVTGKWKENEPKLSSKSHVTFCSDCIGDSVDNSDSPQPIHSIFSIEFYQKFFNVDTNIVSERITSAIIPRRAPVNYLKQNIGSNPDLYGPFWIVVTLVNTKLFRMPVDYRINNLRNTFQVFSIAISGNIASYLQETSNDYHWRYNFHLVSFAATTIVMYVCFIPLILWAAFKWSARPIDSDLIVEQVTFVALLT